MFNGVDVIQSKYYIKIHCGTWLFKTLKNLGWLLPSDAHRKVNPLPYSADHTFGKALDTATPPTTEAEQAELSNEMGIHYRQVMGLFMWPMVKTRPDYSFHITKISQAMNNPTRQHYQAIRSIGEYPAHTLDDGIYYWRTKPNQKLPFRPLPQCRLNTHQFTTDPTLLTDDVSRRRRGV
jgi:hypothetical protein